MAARTLTYTANYGTVRQPHSGITAVAWDFNSGATKFGTLSDMLLLGKIPNKSIVLEKELRMGANGAAATHLQLQLLAVEANGAFSLLANLITSLTGSATAAVYTDYIPYKISLSDDRAVQYAVLALNCSTGLSETTSFSMQGIVNYLSDGRDL